MYSFLQHSHFINFMHSKDKPHLARRIKKLKPDYVRMPWQTIKNSTDCGIFLMRHMETFNGDTKNWDTELSEEGVRITFLNFFHLTYCLFNFN